MNQGLFQFHLASSPASAWTVCQPRFASAGEEAAWRFIEFFTANIRNKNTRAAYAQAVTQFFDWCTARKISELDQIRPVVIAGYIEELAATRSAPTVKQHLAAIRMMFDYLVIGQVVSMNPASSVRGPKYVTKKGKTPVLKADEARALLDSNRHQFHRGTARSGPHWPDVLHLC